MRNTRSNVIEDIESSDKKENAVAVMDSVGVEVLTGLEAHIFALAAKLERAKVKKTHPAAAKAVAKRAVINILVVDDEQSMRDMFYDLFSEYACKVVSAKDGLDALKKARKTDFDLIFMDAILPRMDGVKTFKEIKKITPKAKVIMMTGYATGNFLKEAREEGASACIYKPFEIKQVIDVLKDCEKPVMKKITKSR